MCVGGGDRLTFRPVCFLFSLVFLLESLLVDELGLIECRSSGRPNAFGSAESVRYTSTRQYASIATERERERETDRESMMEKRKVCVREGNNSLKRKKKEKANKPK